MGPKLEIFLSWACGGDLGSRGATVRPPGLLSGHGGLWHHWRCCATGTDASDGARKLHGQPEARGRHYVSASRPTGPTQKNLQISWFLDLHVSHIFKLACDIRLLRRWCKKKAQNFRIAMKELTKPTEITRRHYRMYGK